MSVVNNFLNTTHTHKSPRSSPKSVAMNIVGSCHLKTPNSELVSDMNNFQKLHPKDPSKFSKINSNEPLTNAKGASDHVKTLKTLG